MQLKFRQSQCFGFKTLGTVALLLSVSGFASAQVAISGLISPPANGTPATVANSKGKTVRPLLKQMSLDSGAAIECDSYVAALKVTPPDATTTVGNLDRQLDLIVSQLPKGTTWAKLYMPAPTNTSYHPDDVVEFALAEARLFGNTGATLAPGTIEVLGQKLDAEKAASVSKELNLKPLYIVANPNGAAQRSINDRAEALLSLPPDQRAAAVASMMKDVMQEPAQVMASLMQSMTPADQQQFIADLQASGKAMMLQMKKSSGTPPPDGQ